MQATPQFSHARSVHGSDAVSAQNRGGRALLQPCMWRSERRLGTCAAPLHSRVADRSPKGRCSSSAAGSVPAPREDSLSAPTAPCNQVSTSIYRQGPAAAGWCVPLTRFNSQTFLVRPSADPHRPSGCSLLALAMHSEAPRACEARGATRVRRKRTHADRHVALKSRCCMRCAPSPVTARPGCKALS